MEKTCEDASADGCLDFIVHDANGAIPVSFWKARDCWAGLPPVVLVQHGGPFHKRHERTDWLAQAVVERTGAAVLLIDGPIHGLRRQDAPGVEAMLAKFEQHWREHPGIETMVADWRCALDVVIGRGWVDPEHAAWLGTSMGTAYGIPLCAAESRIKAAALGMWGIDWGQEDRLLDAARSMETPALFQIKSGDEIFSTGGQRALFDALGSADKCLRTYPGGHSLTAPGQLDDLLGFVTRAFTGARKVPGGDAAAV